MYFFAFLVIYLAAEGSALVFVAGQTGWLTALLLIFLVSMGGAYLVRRQGALALVRIQEALARNESPDAELLDGTFIFAAGLLLFLPGFLTDLAGIALLVPPLRKVLAPWLLSCLKKRVERGQYIKTYTVYDYEWRDSRGDSDQKVKVIDVASHQASESRPENQPGPDSGPAGKDKGSDS